MRNFILALLLLFCISPIQVRAQENRTTDLQTEVASLRHKLSALESSLSSTRRELETTKTSLWTANEKIDSLSGNIKTASDKLSNDISESNNSLNNSINQKEESITDTTNQKVLYLIIAILIVGIVTIVLFYMLKKKTSSTESTINTIRDAQRKLQEESIKLDTKLAEMLEKKLEIEIQPVKTNPKEEKKDHSLILMIADEMVRLQNNISKMDSEDKNVKRIEKSLSRMRTSITAYGYEIVDLVGQEYTDNMTFEARFIPDDSLEEGKSVISGMDKLMIRFNGEMIQAPKLVVRQN